MRIIQLPYMGYTGCFYDQLMASRRKSCSFYELTFIAILMRFYIQGCGEHIS